jgi:VanZ family protein
MKTIVKRWIPAILYTIFTFSLSSISGSKLQYPIFLYYDKLLHAILYAGAYLAFLFAIRFPYRTLIAVLAFAAIDEYYQSFIPGRSSSIYDWLADATGASIFMILCLIYERYKNSRAH